jgi:hypothetical protein
MSQTCVSLRFFFFDHVIAINSSIYIKLSTAEEKRAEKALIHRRHHQTFDAIKEKKLLKN